MVNKHMNMMYTKLVTVCLVSLVILVGCGSSETDSQKETETQKDVVTEETAIKESQNKKEGLVDASVNMGDVFTKGNLKYHVLSVRTNEVNEDTKMLIPKIEVYNAGTEKVKFTPMETLNLVDMKNEECPLDLFAATDGALAGTILPGNKVIGEVAFDISHTDSEAYVIQVGVFYDAYEPAIKINMASIDQVYDEVFESKGIDTDLGIGSAIESNQFTIELSKAILSNEHVTHKAFKAEEGSTFLITDFIVKNNTTESQSFLTSFFIKGFLENGTVIEPISRHTSIPVSIEPNGSVEGQIVWDVPDGEKSFYLSVMPDLGERDDVYYVSFQLE